ncbi:hypothetical protein [Laribacter hongkongensis]|jgi:hypothetical protein|uniref:hypothetical protein n=1 Tax=Laribacter hongkongensis TaxID=168471 RepID=UPI001EFE3053|nr:hypothetical protein [Laribacter hongkongensis]MCG9093786.1 hypothetical protein [Laribacter hongkongensis]
MFKKIASLAALSTVATGVLAAGTGPDLTPLTSVVDFGTVITAVLAIAGLLAGVYVAIKGAKIVIGMVRGA